MLAKVHLQKDANLSSRKFKIQRLIWIFLDDKETLHPSDWKQFCKSNNSNITLGRSIISRVADGNTKCTSQPGRRPEAYFRVPQIRHKSLIFPCLFTLLWSKTYMETLWTHSLVGNSLDWKEGWRSQTLSTFSKPHMGSQHLTPGCGWQWPSWTQWLSRYGDATLKPCRKPPLSWCSKFPVQRSPNSTISKVPRWKCLKPMILSRELSPAD